MKEAEAEDLEHIKSAMIPPTALDIVSNPVAIGANGDPVSSTNNQLMKEAKAEGSERMQSRAIPPTARYMDCCLLRTSCTLGSATCVLHLLITGIDHHLGAPYPLNKPLTGPTPGTLLPWPVAAVLPPFTSNFPPLPVAGTPATSAMGLNKDMTLAQHITDRVVLPSSSPPPEDLQPTLIS